MCPALDLQRGYYLRSSKYIEVQDMRVINYPHSPTTSSDNYSCLNFVLFFEILKTGDGWTDNMCENSDHYRP